jgi:hypothetical protein
MHATGYDVRELEQPQLVKARRGFRMAMRRRGSGELVMAPFTKISSNGGKANAMLAYLACRLCVRHL